MVIVRYFVVEDHILNTTSGLVTQVYLDELWDLALSKIIPVLRIHIVSNRFFLSCLILLEIVVEFTVTSAKQVILLSQLVWLLSVNSL